MAKKTVLVADDQLFMVENVIAQLKEDYDVLTASCGHDALKAIKKGGLDAVILDGSMPPGPNGDDIAIYVRRQYPCIPVILQSGEYGKYLHLEGIGIKVMSKCDEIDIAAYVKQILGVQRA